jgi:cohesin loading factor subunit SCC2
MPKTAAKFGSELQLALQPMILKPSTAGGVQVGDGIPCLEWWITPDI